jgi:hypothetical protein
VTLAADGGVMPAGPEKHWREIDTAPAGVALRIVVADRSGGHHVLPYPCRQTTTGWVSAVTGAPLVLRPTHWQLYQEGLPAKRAWVRRSSAARQESFPLVVRPLKQ